ncbi:MAG TPA: hypothetical protein VHP13_02640 [Gammaproteobacteria bacterium]|nr:hypothetical protein [Gammaproteobacteria bacterium]
MHYILDSYQNVVCSPVDNEGIESIGPRPDPGSMEHAGDGDPDYDNPERLAGDLSSDRAEGDSKRRSPSGHGSGDRNEPGYAEDDESVRGRGASGESYEDEADEALFRPRRGR